MNEAESRQSYGGAKMNKEFKETMYSVGRHGTLRGAKK